MANRTHIILGLLGSATFAAAIEFVPIGSLILLTITGLLALAGLAGGTRLPLFLRVFTTAIAFYLGFNLCLVGRTMAPGLNGYTLQMAVVCFLIFSAVPLLSLLRIWSGQTKWLLAVALLPFSLLTAELVAGTEEYLFVKQHEATGAGPTKRWTVSNHWLAYDRETHRLSGSD